MKKLLIFLMCLGLIGCAYSISGIDVSNKDSSCIRQCTVSYSSCASGGPSVGFKTETLRACREAYSICVGTCPVQ